MVPFDTLYPVVPSISAVSVHDESDVFRDWALSQRANQQLSKVIESPFCGWRGHKPFSQPRRHVVGLLGEKQRTSSAEKP
jgi:hypothetical protein